MGRYITPACTCDFDNIAITQNLLQLLYEAYRIFKFIDVDDDGKSSLPSPQHEKETIMYAE